ncbi:MAG: hypothetical protein A2539_02460 [Elusimicrobia bacterium RIFOXYD2_FULL_34_15]|nr:MAG: hypothetical protein A2539_02460 [Elusimicrobia bacterium RIFOXYD2_FULL_34_15]
MKKIILVIGLLVFVQLGWSELTQDTTHQLKLIKLTEDAITDDSYKPIAGKEKLLAVKVVDPSTPDGRSGQGESGKGVFGAEVRFSIQDKDCGFIVVSTREAQTNEIIIRTNIIGEAIVFLKVSDTKNTVLTSQVVRLYSPQAFLVNKPTEKVIWNIQTTELPERIERNFWHKAIKDNENKLQSYKANLEIDSNESGQPSKRTMKLEKRLNQKLKVTDKGKSYETNPENFWYPPLYDTEPIAYNQKTKTLIVRNILKDGNLYPYRLLYVDFPGGIIIKEERYRYFMNGLVHKFETEYNGWTEDRKIKGGFRYKKKIEKGNSGLKNERFRTTTKVTDVGTDK